MGLPCTVAKFDVTHKLDVSSAFDPQIVVDASVTTQIIRPNNMVQMRADLHNMYKSL